jgi:hypothetical protein
MDQPDQRDSPRRKVLKAAKISFHNGGASTDCTVRNMSHTGACLLVASPIGIPDTFDLVIEADQSVTHCRVEWRSATKIGVSFN